MEILSAVGEALRTSFDMFWEVLWPLILGFGLSAIVQVFVSHRTMATLLGDNSPRSLTLATLFGVASSSCSYAAVALWFPSRTSRQESGGTTPGTRKQDGRMTYS